MTARERDAGFGRRLRRFAIASALLGVYVAGYATLRASRCLMFVELCPNGFKVPPVVYDVRAPEYLAESPGWRTRIAIGRVARWVYYPACRAEAWARTGGRPTRY